MRVERKYAYQSGRRWAFMKWMDIPTANDLNLVYLRRLRIVQTPWCALYLHCIYESDADRDPHDHPFTFRSIVLRGGYTGGVWQAVSHQMRAWGEVDLVMHGPVRRTHKRFSLHKLSSDSCHTITEITEPLVTLVFAGKKTQQWGFFLEDASWVPWADYNRIKYGSENLAPTGEARAQIDEHS